MKELALVTGGTRGIGAAIARELKDAGLRVIANFATDGETAERFTADTGIEAIAWDVADGEACERKTKTIIDKHGPIQVLVNNAGVTRDASIKKMNPAMWKKVIEVNLGGCFNMARSVLPSMRETGWGRIVNIGSINGQQGQFGQANYSAAKAGLSGLTKALAREVARDGVTVNLIAPGYTETDMVAAVPQEILEDIKAMIPTGRFSAPDEIAWAVRFLTDHRSGQMTGSTLTVNGGHYMT